MPSSIFASLIQELVPQGDKHFSKGSIVWRFTFGKYVEHTFGSGYRFLVYFRRRACKFHLDLIREETERMRHGDSRAAGPKVPDDVWDFPRVVNQHLEYQDWHPTQHPVVLYDRIMKVSCGGSGVFLDLFAGSGTCFRAGRLNRNIKVIGVEIEPEYCKKMHELSFLNK